MYVMKKLLTGPSPCGCRMIGCVRNLYIQMQDTQSMQLTNFTVTVMTAINALYCKPLYVLLTDGTQLVIRCGKTHLDIEHHKEDSMSSFRTPLIKSTHG